jgi:hypothetical protein
MVWLRSVPAAIIGVMVGKTKRDKPGGSLMIFGAVLASDLSVDIRRELFQDIGSHINAELDSELHDRIRGVPVVRVVSIGNGNSNGIADNFRVVEALLSGIHVVPKDLAHGIAEAGERCAGTVSEVTGS